MPSLQNGILHCIAQHKSLNAPHFEVLAKADRVLPSRNQIVNITLLKLSTRSNVFTAAERRVSLTCQPAAPLLCPLVTPLGVRRKREARQEGIKWVKKNVHQGRGSLRCDLCTGHTGPGTLA